MNDPFCRAHRSGQYMRKDRYGFFFCEACEEEKPEEDYPEDRVTPTYEEFEAYWSLFDFAEMEEEGFLW